MTSKRNQRLLELDALRGFAVLAVVCYHYFYRYNSLYVHKNIPVDWAYLGRYGVELFFMVSGFVIFWTLNRAEKPLDFIVSRFSRLYPAYWCALIVTFSAVSYFGLPGREILISNALVNVLMFQEYLRIPHVDGVYWTLTVELTFYFWMFIFYLRDSFNKVEGVFSCLIIVSVLHSTDVINVPNLIVKILILKYIPFFMAGICFYRIINGSDNLKVTMGVLFLSLISTIAIYSFKLFLVYSIFYMVFYLALSGRLKFLSIKPFVFMGSISYSLYLLHQNIGYILINKFYEMQWNPLIGILFSVIFSTVLATILSKYIEVPSLICIRNWYKNKVRCQLPN